MARRGLTHLDARHQPAMVDVGAKDVTHRVAVAEARIRLPRGRYLHCPNGSHLAMYDDQETYFTGLIDFLLSLGKGS